MHQHQRWGCTAGVRVRAADWAAACFAWEGGGREQRPGRCSLWARSLPGRGRVLSAPGLTGTRGDGVARRRSSPRRPRPPATVLVGAAVTTPFPIAPAAKWRSISDRRWGQIRERGGSLVRESSAGTPYGQSDRVGGRVREPGRNRPGDAVTEASRTRIWASLLVAALLLTGKAGEAARRDSAPPARSMPGTVIAGRLWCAGEGTRWGRLYVTDSSLHFSVDGDGCDPGGDVWYDHWGRVLFVQGHGRPGEIGYVRRSDLASTMQAFLDSMPLANPDASSHSSSLDRQVGEEDSVSTGDERFLEVFKRVETGSTILRGGGDISSMVDRLLPGRELPDSGSAVDAYAQGESLGLSPRQLQVVSGAVRLYWGYASTLVGCDQHSFPDFWVAYRPRPRMVPTTIAMGGDSAYWRYGWHARVLMSEDLLAAPASTGLRDLNQEPFGP